jgi:hypothetical protein
MSVPMEQMPPMQEQPQEQQGVGGGMLSEEDEQDIDIAIAAALEMIDTPEGEQQLQQIMSQPNPMELLAMFLAKMIEAVMTGEGGDEINPAVWFAEGGVLDDMSDELDQISDADISSLMPELKQATLEKVKRMAAEFQKGGQPAPQASQTAQPMKPPPALGA